MYARSQCGGGYESNQSGQSCSGYKVGHSSGGGTSGEGPLQEAEWAWPLAGCGKRAFGDSKVSDLQMALAIVRGQTPNSGTNCLSHR